MHKILVVEDSELTQRLLSELLGKTYALTIAGTLAAANRELSNQTFDLMILDAGLPDGDGFQFFAMIRSEPKYQDVPVLFLTGKATSEDKVRAFRLGADDYIVKPFDHAELKARVEVRLLRSNRSRSDKEILQVGKLNILVAQQQVAMNVAGTDKTLDLTPFEFKILQFLARHEGEVFSRETLLNRLWGNSVHVADRTVDTHISNLRRKIAGSDCEIKAVQGVGYCLKISTSKVAKQAA